MESFSQTQPLTFKFVLFLSVSHSWCFLSVVKLLKQKSSFQFWLFSEILIDNWWWKPHDSLWVNYHAVIFIFSIFLWNIMFTLTCTLTLIFLSIESFSLTQHFTFKWVFSVSQSQLMPHISSLIFLIFNALSNLHWQLMEKITWFFVTVLSWLIFSFSVHSHD